MDNLVRIPIHYLLKRNNEYDKIVMKYDKIGRLFR